MSADDTYNGMTKTQIIWAARRYEQAEDLRIRRGFELTEKATRATLVNWLEQLGDAELALNIDNADVDDLWATVASTVVEYHEPIKWSQVPQSPGHIEGAIYGTFGPVHSVRNRFAPAYIFPDGRVEFDNLHIETTSEQERRLRKEIASAMPPLPPYPRRPKVKPVNNGDAKPYAVTGDVNPFLYGGGIILADKNGRDATWIVWPEIDDDADDGAGKIEVFVISVPFDVFADANWAKITEVANSSGIGQAELRRMGRSEDVGERVEAIRAIAGHYGYVNFDGYANRYTIKGLKKQYGKIWTAANRAETARAKKLTAASEKSWAARRAGAVDNPGPPPGSAPLLERGADEQQRILRRCVKQYGKRSCMGSLMLLEQLAAAKSRDRVRRLRAFVATLPGEPHANPHDPDWHAIAIIIVPFEIDGARLTPTQVTELTEL